jgi:hypothetical protein
VLGDEDVVAVLVRKHVASVEPHPERGDVRTQVLRRPREFGTPPLCTKLRIRDVTTVAERVAEVKPGLGGSIELIRGQIVTQLVTAIVGEPQLVGVRVPVETDRVPNPACEHLAPGPGDAHAGDRRVQRILRQADVARRTDLQVQQTVGSKTDELPSVELLGREIVAYDDRIRWVRKPLVDIVKPQNAADLSHVERTVLPGDPVRHLEPAGDSVYRVGHMVVIGIDDSVHHPLPAGTNVQDAAGAQRHRAGVGNVIGEDLDPKPLRQPDLVDWQTVLTARRNRPNRHYTHHCGHASRYHVFVLSSCLTIGCTYDLIQPLNHDRCLA